jgi:uncharacterized C2H2 Zn-finger protein
MIRSKGTHTWDLFLSYHKCPKCDFIMESRKDFVYQDGMGYKELECPRCHHNFREEHKSSTRHGPLFGMRPKPEFDWSE